MIVAVADGLQVRILAIRAGLSFGRLGERILMLVLFVSFESSVWDVRIVC